MSYELFLLALGYLCWHKMNPGALKPRTVVKWKGRTRHITVTRLANGEEFFVCGCGHSITPHYCVTQEWGVHASSLVIVARRSRMRVIWHCKSCHQFTSEWVAVWQKVRNYPVQIIDNTTMVVFDDVVLSSDEYEVIDLNSLGRTEQ